MKTSEFYFDLPEELIAQEPLKDRSSSRLLVADKNTESISHRHFRDIKEYQMCIRDRVQVISAEVLLGHCWQKLVTMLYLPT